MGTVGSGIYHVRLDDGERSLLQGVGDAAPAGAYPASGGRGDADIADVPGPEAANALRVAGWYGRRRLIEEWFNVLRTGSRIRDRRPSAADGLRRLHRHVGRAPCARLAGQAGADRRPPGRDTCPRRAHGQAEPPQQRGLPDPDQTVREFAVNTARLAGFIPSRRQPTPGTRKLWEGYLILSLFTENHRAMRDYADIESTVLH